MRRLFVVGGRPPLVEICYRGHVLPNIDEYISHTKEKMATNFVCKMANFSPQKQMACP